MTFEKDFVSILLPKQRYLFHVISPESSKLVICSFLQNPMVIDFLNQRRSETERLERRNAISSGHFVYSKFFLISGRSGFFGKIAIGLLAMILSRVSMTPTALRKEDLFELQKHSSNGDSFKRVEGHQNSSYGDSTVLILNPMISKKSHKNHKITKKLSFEFQVKISGKDMELVPF